MRMFPGCDPLGRGASWFREQRVSGHNLRPLKSNTGTRIPPLAKRINRRGRERGGQPETTRIFREKGKPFFRVLVCVSLPHERQ